MSTNAYAAKKALFTYLQTLTGPGDPLAGTTERPIVVAYGWPTEPGLRTVYGGGVRFDQRQAVAEGTGTLVAETANVSVYVRCIERPSCDPEITDQQCLEIGMVLAAALRTDPTLGVSGFRVDGITGGLGDYHRNDDETVSTLAYSVAVISHFNYGVLT
jgi:hypothetical protein